MNYVYDVVLNFTYPLIDFYEWNNDDNIENVKKIPLFRINNKQFYEIKNYNYKLNNIDNIKNMTKLFNKKTYLTCAIYIDDEETLAIKYDEKGNVIGKSSLLIDEEVEILSNYDLLPISNLDYELLCKDNLKYTVTRKQRKILNFIINEIKNTNDIDKLKYISYECLNEINISKKSLISKINNTWNDKYYKIYDIFKSISMNKN